MFIKIADRMAEEGLKFYSIGQHKGECTEAFSVIKDYTLGDTTSKIIKTQTVDIFPFHPLGRYSKLSAYIDTVDKVVTSIPGIERIYDGSPIMIDDQKKAYTTRLSYRIKKRRDK